MYIGSGNTVGVISGAHSESIINNVNVLNETIDINTANETNNYIGGLVSLLQGTIRNSSVTNLKINEKNRSMGYFIGGLVGRAKLGNIENSFVQNIDINVPSATENYIGGLVGRNENVAQIKNAYSIGKITTEASNIGGIVGYVTQIINIENCYSKVNIIGRNNIGGIVGSFSDDLYLDGITNNLSIGSLYSTLGIDHLNRITGTNNDTTNNYAYENQLLNGFRNNESKGAILLNKEETLNFDLGNSYNYDNSEKGILPKLYNSEGTEILPNQQDNYLDISSASGENINLEISNITANKINTEEAEIEIRINNPSEVEITQIIIQDVETNITRNITQNGITNITVKAIPKRYYDNYILTQIQYKNNEQQETLEVQAEVELQFYKEIYTFEDWQRIEENISQNYKLMADIDFAGKTNIKHNININRLESENGIHTLKNIELEFNTQNSGFIKNIGLTMKNIKFEQITLTNTGTSGSYFGVIASNNGNLENIEFSNITINAEKINNVGCIGYMTTGKINKANLNEITISGNDYVGGLVGYVPQNASNDLEIKQINAINVHISGISQVGGIFGQNKDFAQKYTNISNITIINSEIKGEYSRVGGITGFGQIAYGTVKNCEITGEERVGGIAGKGIHLMYCEVDSSNVNGSGNYIGGISGEFNNHGNYLIVTNSIIEGTTESSNYVGGVQGYRREGDQGNIQIQNTTIKSKGNYVGGIIRLF